MTHCFSVIQFDKSLNQFLDSQLTETVLVLYNLTSLSTDRIDMRQDAAVLVLYNLTSLSTGRKWILRAAKVLVLYNLTSLSTGSECWTNKA